VLDKIAQGIFVFRLVLHEKNIGVCIAAALLHPFSIEDRIWLYPFILMQRLYFLILVIQLVLDLHVDSIVVVIVILCLGSFLAFPLPCPPQRYLQLSNGVQFISISPVLQRLDSLVIERSLIQGNISNTFDLDVLLVPWSI